MTRHMSFWQTLKKPIIVLAPLANVTDASFRRVIAEYSAHRRTDGSIGGPDVMWTEFVSADGLMRATEEGKRKLLADLIYTEAERPIVAQLFSSHPEYMEGAAALCRELGFDGIDINMGCPDRTIEKQGSGSAMIRNPQAAKEVIRAAKRGAAGLPVSVKTRIGYTRDELDTWLPALLEEKPAVITIHARTRKEMSKVPARWEHVKHAVEIRDALQKEVPGSDRTLIFGNGDVASLADAHAKAAETGADGVMLGRAIFGNPWLFDPGSVAAPPSPQDRLEVLKEHCVYFETLLPHKSFAIMKKHFKAYVQGWEGAKELRERLMETESAAEVIGIIDAYRAEHAVLSGAYRIREDL
jgi:nifR3 family TIM-barrel protein